MMLDDSIGEPRREIIEVNSDQVFWIGLEILPGFDGDRIRFAGAEGERRSELRGGATEDVKDGVEDEDECCRG